MSGQRVKRITKSFPFSATWVANVLTVTTQTAHYLVTGDTIGLVGATQLPFNGDVTVINSTVFTVPMNLEESDRYKIGTVVIGFHRTGQTGIQDIFSIGETIAAAGVVQVTAHGTGGATLDIHVSNDNDGWVTIGTITLPGTDHATAYLQVSSLWQFARMNISVIGANTMIIATAAF